MAVSYARVTSTDTLQKGAVYRVTFERSPWTGWLSANSAQDIWTAIEGVSYPVFRVSPMPANEAVAVIDVKARTDAPSQSVGSMVGALDRFANWSVTRVELLGSEDMSPAQATKARAALTTQAQQERAFNNPLDRVFDAFGALRWVAVAGAVVALVYVFVTYVPKPKRRK